MVGPEFNGHMKIKSFAGVFAAFCIFAQVMFGQTLQITGTVKAVTTTQITLQSGTDTWTIKRDATTRVTSGSLTVGSIATVKCASPDAHKNEGIASPTPAG
jgi:hypothetical protein